MHFKYIVDVTCERDTNLYTGEWFADPCGYLSGLLNTRLVC